MDADKLFSGKSAEGKATKCRQKDLTGSCDREFDHGWTQMDADAAQGKKVARRQRNAWQKI